MEITEYQLQAQRTCPTLGSIKLDLAHMVLGIFSEYEEYLNNTDIINKSEECSDIMWYISNYCTFRNYNLEIMWNLKFNNFKHFTENVSTLQDYIKKYIAYNKPIDTYNEQHVIKAILRNIHDMYGTVNYKQSLENNINKLKVRFPDKFTEHNAINRNLVKERNELAKEIPY